MFMLCLPRFSKRTFPLPMTRARGASVEGVSITDCYPTKVA